MSYIVLARKYRPQSFSEVYAQDHVTKILQSAIESGRIAHAYLFTGPRGVGKTSLARIMAKSLNCEQGPTINPCNICTNCKEITSGVSSDVIEIDGASNTGVDDIRELQKELLYAASGSKYKIYIIDEVHMLSKNAFNALLKTLEEPPENVIFIFATTEPHKVLPTIISRCQRYDFKRIPVEAIVRRLRDICDKEEINADDESLYLIARKADGGMRDALSLMDQTISYCANDIKINSVRQIFGMIPNQLYYNFLCKLKEHDTQGVVIDLHQIFEEGIDLQEFIANKLEFLRLVLLSQLGIKINDVSSEEMPLFENVAKMFSQNDLLYIMSQLIQTRSDIRISNNPYLLIEATMIKLSRLDEINDISKLITDLKRGAILSDSVSVTSSASRDAKPETKEVPAKKVASQPRSPQVAEIGKLEASEENIRSNWEALAQRIRKSSLIAGIAFAKAEFISLNENALVLQTDSPTNLNAIDNQKERIERILADVFGKPLRLILNLEEKEAPTKVNITRKTIADIQTENPELKGFIEQTDARLI
ncbi:MAG: DNA polymerase III subunit gamma/tau [Candidatus Cloacimonetes bacterium]|jgi:DNA polymerase-3 subunit gamma/tau|nr:DNA polymerase III subunit gamma/tau [Candidatus Cloacimonadota bacterium]MDY0298644.1 DNA polymerase III subunit gamma/tau [Candidatus Cloacimonadaceae bacterium]MCB5278506.1 DNA polymerase III subunit gamma/tau [Candidatus Cloacimonadota bacterium]MCK9333587.1 DNA polymerase III subunit gamma/tau [Candidatus Cloacimonadota bacterium]MDD2210613.1 DNA polymerase III subunit gamma/tau [Candidatus Cloacimonadota bacterium]